MVSATVAGTSLYGTVTRQADANGFRLREVVVRGSGLRTRRHRHASAYFALTLQGGFTQTFASATVACRPGTLLFHPSSEVHSDHFQAPEVRILQIEIAPSRLKWLGISLAAVPGCADLSRPRLGRVARELYSELLRFDPHSPLAIEGLALEFLALTRREAAGRERRAGPDWLAQVREQLAHRYTERLHLAELAAAVGVHPAHLAREFRRYEGCTVGERLRQLRIEYACREIGLAQRSLAEIAFTAGFADQSHLTRTFRGRTGMTPGEYRCLQPPSAPGR